MANTTKELKRKAPPMAMTSFRRGFFNPFAFPFCVEVFGFSGLLLLLPMRLLLLTLMKVLVGSPFLFPYINGSLCFLHTLFESYRTISQLQSSKQVFVQSSSVVEGNVEYEPSIPSNCQLVPSIATMLKVMVLLMQSLLIFLTQSEDLSA
ncbi:hypothetical protein Sjap_018509 [Stephania japonica]|uniref:Transmembrane protein n=1 Tax=Stephania japonica TaxID=461633 RepID=A0AAP0I837_9MAGN